MARVTYAARVAPVGYVGQVLPTSRRLSTPLVLAECEHAHRTERTAAECARRLDTRTVRNYRGQE